MPFLPSDEFLAFTQKIGLRKEHAAALWEADIRTPQELAALRQDQLKDICNDPLLLNFYHPLLHKYLYHIATSSDPFKKALHVIDKNAPKHEDMEVSGTAADSTASDAEGYRDGARPAPNGATPERVGNTFENSGSRVSASGNRSVQTHVGKEDDTKSTSISIHGGNFVQSSIMSKGPVTYNNTNTVISTTLGPEGGTDMSLDVKKLRQHKLNESLLLNGNLVQVKDVGWMSGGDYWIGDDLKVASATREQYTSSYGRNDVYPVRNFGKNRALIINNYEFSRNSGMATRNGAARDTENMFRILTQVGFQVTQETNKTKDAMLQLLREFAASQDNIAADMVAVYIGSHGQRDEKGFDTFVGVDGERIKFDEVREIFSPARCRFLIDKPKIFFLQFCRQENNPKPPAAMAHPSSDRRTRYDGDPFGGEDESQEDLRPMDFLCVYATLAGNKAYRDTLDGSWFVSCLVRILSENANREDLQSMLTQVNNSVSAMDGQEGNKRALQISEVVHNLRKKIFFWPGI